MAGNEPAQPGGSGGREWRLQGRGAVVPALFNTEKLAPWLHPGVRPLPIPFSPWTPGGVIIARYEAGSTLEYSELALGILARPSHGRPGFYCFRLWVDNPDSIRGGAEIWGLRKEFARFEWIDLPTGWTVNIVGQERLLADIREFPGARRLAVPLTGGCFSYSTRGAVLRWAVRSRSALRLARVHAKLLARDSLFAKGSRVLGLGLALDPLRISVTFPS